MKDNIFNLLVEQEGWVAELQARNPIVYIAAGIFGIILFLGFIAAIIGIVIAIKKHKPAETGEHIANEYMQAKGNAISMVVDSLKASNLNDDEIRQILKDRYHLTQEEIDKLLWKKE